jgi:hypothetical protein
MYLWLLQVTNIANYCSVEVGKIRTATASEPDITMVAKGPNQLTTKGMENWHFSGARSGYGTNLLKKRPTESYPA